ncbi:MAG: hypothetical protein J6C40_07170 [Lentisphaeria bacterium]|nr:hypothetical protein [Lentisphaeria bacterium]
MTSSWFDNRTQRLFRRYYSKKRRLTRRFDLLTLALALVIVLAVWAARGGDCGISSASPGGFALWFLLFLSYIPLALLSFLDWCVSGDLFQTVSSLLGRDQAVLLGVFNMLSLLLVWGSVRILAARKYGEHLLRTTGHFILIFLIWGCFQLCCSLSVRMWQSGGISGFHSGLKVKK